MGTNFYAILPIKKRTTNKLRELADKLDASQNINIDNELHNIQEELKDHEIHLGKRSFGWAFLWDHNNLKYYKPTLESIKKFIDDNNAKIVDEYDREFTWDEFINDEIAKCLYPSIKPITTVEELKEACINIDLIEYIKENYLSKNRPYYRYCTSKTYHKMHPDEKNFNYVYRDYDQRLIKYTYDTIINGNYSDFITKEGLRFALFTDFS